VLPAQSLDCRIAVSLTYTELSIRMVKLAWNKRGRQCVGQERASGIGCCPINLPTPRGQWPYRPKYKDKPSATQPIIQQATREQKLAYRELRLAC